MPESINLFNAGMNSDLSPVFQQKGTYINAINIELLSDALQGSIAISNSKGNKIQQSLPNVGNIYKLILSPTVFGIVNITINGITFPFTNSATATHLQLYNLIIANFNITEFNTYYDDVKVVIVPISPIVLLVTVDNNLILTGSDISTGGIGPYIATQTNLQPIGYGIINDDIYIFSTNCKDINPQSTGNGIGQIWKLTYDNIGFDASLSTITLIYSANLAFTTYYHIPQTAVVTRYENSLIQRIYWTDNYNRLRQLNVADIQAFALDVSLLELIPAIDFDIPILSEIHEGGVATIKVGSYQLAYRFKNTTGSVTNFSPLSNIVSIVNHGESVGVLSNTTNEFRAYTGDAFSTTTTKVVSWTINNIDIDFDRIEFIVLIRELYNDVPAIYSFHEEATGGRESISVQLDGDILASTDTTTLTLSEFLLLSGYFTHGKTLSTKDNRFIAGNIRTASADIAFDARAYRWNATPQLDLIENSVTNTYTLATLNTIGDESDAINPGNTFKYKSDGSTLGGEGLNISYEFISVAIKSDVANNVSNNFDFSNTNLTSLNGFRSTIHDIVPSDTLLDLNVFSSDKNNNDVLQEYSLALPQINYEDMKYPQHNANYWGYQQNETYRVSIQFYNKAKNPYFVKWIGDIKFPDINDNVLPANTIYENGVPTSQTKFVKSFVTIQSDVNWPGKTIAWITQLGLKLSINIPANLTEIISGYSIVRVKREESDKTVIAEGIITSVADVRTAGNYWTPDPTGGHFLDSASYILPEARTCFFNTPNHLISGVTEPRATDTLTVRRAFQSAANLNTTDLASGNPDLYYIYRLYNDIATTSQSFTIGQVLNLSIGQDSTSLNGFPVNNNDNLNVSLGNQCYYFDLTGVALLNYGAIDRKLYATVDRVLTNQYGGNTYGDRAANEYILCSHFRSVKNSSTTYSDSPIIFGGDTINYHIDMQRSIKDWPGASSPKHSTTFIFPAGSCANVGFRYGTFVNYNLLTDTATAGQASFTETYDYNRVYSNQNDIVKFFPKPEPFISNNEFPNRFRISEIKINGELSDSWSSFKENNYWDVEGTYGEINSSLIMNDKLYFWQDRAFGIMQVNPQTLVQSTDGVALQTGTGLPLQRHDYISTVIGTKHQSSTISSSSKLYWYDTNTRKIYTFNSDGINPFSDVKGMYSYLHNNLSGEINNIDKPLYIDAAKGVNGIAATYDFKRHKAIFTFHSGINTGRDEYTQTSFTLAINELNDTFLGFYSFIPRMYINDFKYIISNDILTNVTLKNLYIHDIGVYGNYYGIRHDSYIKFIVNEAPQFTKVFDNLVYDSQSKNGVVNNNDDTWNSIRITNDYQNTDVIPLIYNTNIKRKERSWQLAIPRNRVLYTASNSPDIYTDLSLTAKPFAERIRDKYIAIELTYDNNNDYQLLTNNIKTIFRTSSR